MTSAFTHGFTTPDDLPLSIRATPLPDTSSSTGTAGGAHVPLNEVIDGFISPSALALLQWCVYRYNADKEYDNGHR